MKYILCLFFLTCFSWQNAFSQQTFSEYEVKDGVEIETIKNEDLNVIKRVWRNRDKEILSYVEYNPTTGEAEGNFYNGVFAGTIKNGLITSDNYTVVKDYTSSESGNPRELIIQGPIVEGRLDGNYPIILREYSSQVVQNESDRAAGQMYKQATGIEVSWGHREVSYSDYSDTQVGHIIAQNGKYKSFTLNLDNEFVSCDFDEDGFPVFFLRRDNRNQRIIDSIDVSGKIGIVKGKFEKLNLSLIGDSIYVPTGESIPYINCNPIMYNYGIFWSGYSASYSPGCSYCRYSQPIYYEFHRDMLFVRQGSMYSWSDVVPTGGGLTSSPRHDYYERIEEAENGEKHLMVLERSANSDEEFTSNILLNGELVALKLTPVRDSIAIHSWNWPISDSMKVVDFEQADLLSYLMIFKWRLNFDSIIEELGTSQAYQLYYNAVKGKDYQSLDNAFIDDWSLLNIHFNALPHSEENILVALTKRKEYNSNEDIRQEVDKGINFFEEHNEEVRANNARIREEEERARLAAEEAERKRIAEEERNNARIREEEERARLAAEEAERKRIAEEERKKAEEERQRIENSILEYRVNARAHADSDRLEQAIAEINKALELDGSHQGALEDLHEFCHSLLDQKLISSTTMLFSSNKKLKDVYNKSYRDMVNEWNRHYRDSEIEFVEINNYQSNFDIESLGCEIDFPAKEGMTIMEYRLVSESSAEAFLNELSTDVQSGKIAVSRVYRKERNNDVAYAVYVLMLE